MGLDNSARHTSLKGLEFALDMHELETMPIHHTQKDFTDEEIQKIIDYCKVDLRATWTVFQLVLGNTEHELYKENNQIQLRFDIKEEFGLDCLSYSDIKIGDELMKKSYAEEKGIKVSDLPRSGTFRKEIKLKECIPDYIEFKTPQLQNLLSEIKSKKIHPDADFGYEFIFKNTKYSLLKGGMHSVNTNEKYISNEKYIIYTSDVASFYPVSKIRRKIYPKHLGVEFLNTYEKRYNKRVELKPLSKKERKIKGICDAIKLQLNIIFGKLGSKESLYYDMKALLSVTLGNQLTILKLIEDVEEIGCHVIVANTKINIGVIKPL